MAWRRQAKAITWANVDTDLCRHMASLCHNEFKRIEAGTKWPLFHRQCFEMHFLEWKMYFDSNFIEVCSKNSKSSLIRITAWRRTGDKPLHKLMLTQLRNVSLSYLTLNTLDCFEEYYIHLRFDTCDIKTGQVVDIKPQGTKWPWFNIRMSSYQHRNSHCRDKTILRPSYLHNGISYTGKMTSLYWISPLALFLSPISRLLSARRRNDPGHKQAWRWPSHIPKRVNRHLLITSTERIYRKTSKRTRGSWQVVVNLGIVLN